mmetsp:Transcript_15557/g.44952  ORF Transcript_15557/g.44952 Transcript_15557/m.44952 type:complete len:292 (-) Transcript_15557:71-946(-)
MRVWVALFVASYLIRKPCRAFSSVGGLLDPLGPPNALINLKIADPPLRAYRMLPSGREHSFFIQRTSYEPDSFLLRGFLRPDETRRIMEEEKEMEQAQTVDGGTSARKGCQVGWLDNSKIDGMVGILASAAGNILLAEEVRFSAGAGCEDLQVLNYDKGGEYTFHHDANDRVLTVLYYLNGEGGTWFPLAEVRQHLVESVGPKTREDALRMAHWCKAGSDGLLLCGCSNNECADSNGVVGIEAGDAVAFYNYSTDVQTGRRKPIWKAIHAGVPATTRKWIANHWFHGGNSD